MLGKIISQLLTFRCVHYELQAGRRNNFLISGQAGRISGPFCNSKKPKSLQKLEMLSQSVSFYFL